MNVLSRCIPVATAILAGCATAPAAPSTQMRSIETYPAMGCPQMRAELETVTAWQRHHAEMNAYMEDQASFMRTLDVFSTALTAVGSVVDPSMASMYEETNRSNALSTAQTENAQAQAAVHQQGVSKRQDALRQLLVIKGCN